MANNDLQKWITSDVDFYDFLGLAFEVFSESELRRAYRKTSLKYHPDKTGKDFDPDKWELVEAANAILGSPEYKAKYDNHRNAKLQKQRANELFEGKRRKMKEELEARERSGVPHTAKRPFEETVMTPDLKKFAEEGKRRKAARKSMMGDSIRGDVSSPAPQSHDKKTTPAFTEREATPAAEKQPEEDEVERLERRIREAEAAKAKRKAEKKARKSGVFVPVDSPSVGDSAGARLANQDTTTPIRRSDIFRGLKADERSSASPKFSFSPNTPNTPKSHDFAATMARLKAAEKQRLEEEIRQQESAEVVK